MPIIRNSSVDNSKRQQNKFALTQRAAPSNSRYQSNVYLAGFNQETDGEDQIGTPRSGAARANSCMERLLRDEKRRKEAKI
jgi:hypothetical protein